ncbi:hypothetical protein HDG32_006959 [Paraburkholderia sp. CI2]|nr:hypothetical protein [Paraburkholderia sp. CI2]
MSIGQTHFDVRNVYTERWEEDVSGTTDAFRLVQDGAPLGDGRMRMGFQIVIPSPWLLWTPGPDRRNADCGSRHKNRARWSGRSPCRHELAD